MEGPDHMDPDNTAAVRAHNAAVLAAEGARQVAVAAAGNNQAAVNAATIAFYRIVRSSGITNNLPGRVAAAQQALLALGTGGV